MASRYELADLIHFAFSPSVLLLLHVRLSMQSLKLRLDCVVGVASLPALCSFVVAFHSLKGRYKSIKPRL